MNLDAQKLNALKTCIGRAILPKERWQTVQFFYPVEADMWTALCAWMKRNRIDWRAPDSPVSAIEFRFVWPKP